MLNKKRYECDARDLSLHIVTSWDDYDFKEETDDLERRVPRIVFKDAVDIEVKSREPEHIKGFGYEKFIRRYEVTYRDANYLFVITVDSHFGCVWKYWVTVYLCTENEMSKLLMERL